MKRFEYIVPRSLQEALEVLSARPEAVPLAGGTDLVRQLKESKGPVRAVVSLRALSELRVRSVNGGLLAGAMVRIGELASDRDIRNGYLALATAADTVGSNQIRWMATLGGNLCSAHPTAALAPPLLVLGGEALVAGARGERVVPLDSFFTGPGSTVLGPGELLRAVRAPEMRQSSGSSYVHHATRSRMDPPLVSAAAWIGLAEDGTIEDARLAVGGAGPVPSRVPEAERLLTGETPSAELVREAGSLAARAAQPVDDVHASGAYRRHLVAVLTRRAIAEAVAEVERNATAGAEWTSS